MTHFVLTANHLVEGHVVFLDDNGIWVSDVNRAALAKTPEQKAEFGRKSEAAKAATLIVEPYLVEVTIEAGAVRPIKNRERMRTLGPTVREDLGYQGGNWKSAASAPIREHDHVHV